MHSKKTYNLLILLSVFFLSSCTKQELETKIASQEQQIDRFITAQQDRGVRVVRKNGSNRLVLEEGKDANGQLPQDSLQYGDSVRFYYAGYIFSNGPGTLFATNHEATAQAKGFQLTDPSFEIEAWLYQKNQWIPGLDNGFYGVRTGEHGYIVFSAKHGFEDESLYNIPRLSPLIYEYWIEAIK